MASEPSSVQARLAIDVGILHIKAVRLALEHCVRAWEGITWTEGPGCVTRTVHIRGPRSAVEHVEQFLRTMLP